MNKKKKHITVYRTSGIGDVILSFKGLELINMQSADIYYIGYGSALEIVKYFFPKINTIDIGKNNLMNSFRIINQMLPRLDGFIDLQTNSRSISLMILFWAKYRMPVFRQNKRSLQRRWIVFANRISGRKHKFSFVEKFRQTDAADLLTECIAKCVSHFSVGVNPRTEEQTESINKYEASGKTLVIAPGGSHIVKRAPAELVVSIIGEIHKKESKLKVILTGDMNEVLLCKEIEEALSDEINKKNIAGNKKIVQLIDLLSKADALLATDSAMSHLGAYLNIPVAVLLGPTVEGFGYAVNKEKTRIYSAKISCRPCSRTGNIACAYNDKLCFHNINYKEPANYLLQFLTTG